MVIKKVFEGVFDSEVHNDFIKFSRGEFKDKYLIEAKKQSSNWAVKTGHEYANSLVKSCLLHSKESVKASGIIATTLELRGDITFDISKVSQFQGVKKYIINSEIKTKELLTLMEKYPKAFYALSFKEDKFDLKIKAKSPKSGKSGKDDEDVKVNFCTLKTNNKEILDKIFFDIGLDFKESKINHTLKIEKIVYPEGYERMSPVEIRENSKREGVLIRNITIDGKKESREAKFLA